MHDCCLCTARLPGLASKSTLPSQSSGDGDHSSSSFWAQPGGARPGIWKRGDLILIRFRRSNTGRIPASKGPCALRTHLHTPKNSSTPILKFCCGVADAAACATAWAATVTSCATTRRAHEVAGTAADCDRFCPLHRQAPCSAQRPNPQIPTSGGNLLAPKYPDYPGSLRKLCLEVSKNLRISLRPGYRFFEDFRHVSAARRRKYDWHLRLQWRLLLVPPHLTPPTGGQSQQRGWV